MVRGDDRIDHYVQFAGEAFVIDPEFIVHVVPAATKSLADNRKVTKVVYAGRPPVYHKFITAMSCVKGLYVSTPFGRFRPTQFNFRGWKKPIHKVDVMRAKDWMYGDLLPNCNRLSCDEESFWLAT